MTTATQVDAAGGIFTPEEVMGGRWKEAFRRLRRNPLAMASLAVMLLYGTVGVLDSIGWQDGRNAPRRTVIDRLFEREKERTYSAPLAAMTTGEPHPRPLKAPARPPRWPGCPGSGADRPTAATPCGPW